MKSQTTARQYLEERYESISRRKPADRGIPCFTDLTQEEREIATGKLICTESSDAVSEVLTEANTLYLGAAVGRAFETQCGDYKELFWQELSKQVTPRYEKTIDALFESIHEEALIDAKYNPPFDKNDAYYDSLRKAA